MKNRNEFRYGLLLGAVIAVFSTMLLFYHGSSDTCGLSGAVLPCCNATTGGVEIGLASSEASAERLSGRLSTAMNVLDDPVIDSEPQNLGRSPETPDLDPRAAAIAFGSDKVMAEASRIMQELYEEKIVTQSVADAVENFDELSATSTEAQILIQFHGMRNKYEALREQGIRSGEPEASAALGQQDLEADLGRIKELAVRLKDSAASIARDHEMGLAAR